MEELKVEQRKAFARLSHIYAELAKGEGEDANFLPECVEHSARRATDEPPLERGTRGQGDRIVALVRENPGVDLHWLTEKVYGENTPANRQTLQSLLGYLIHKKGVIQSGGRGKYRLKVNP